MEPEHNSSLHSTPSHHLVEYEVERFGREFAGQLRKVEFRYFISMHGLQLKFK
jgi:hypothetical protein